MGIDFNLIDGIIYTVNGVIDEVDHERYKAKNRNIMMKIHAALESKKLQLKEPSEHYIQRVRSAAKKTGDLRALSLVDQNVIALALELKNELITEPVLYTNDYSMENVCSELNLFFSPLHKRGITTSISWEVYCPQCRKVFPSERLNSLCETCEIPLKRRPKRE